MDNKEFMGRFEPFLKACIPGISKSFFETVNKYEVEGVKKDKLSADDKISLVSTLVLSVTHSVLHKVVLACPEEFRPAILKCIIESVLSMLSSLAEAAGVEMKIQNRDGFCGAPPTKPDNVDNNFFVGL